MQQTFRLQTRTHTHVVYTIFFFGLIINFGASPLFYSCGKKISLVDQELLVIPAVLEEPS